MSDSPTDRSPREALDEAGSRRAPDPRRDDEAEPLAPDASADLSEPAPRPDRARAGVADAAGTAQRRLSARRKPETAGGPHFSQPVRQIVMMLLVLGLVAAGVFLAYRSIAPIFDANHWLNGAIVGVFILGVLTCFWQAAQLVGSVSWIERFAARRRAALKSGVAPREAGDGDAPPSLLAPLAALLGAGGPAGGIISTTAGRSILDSVATRIEEARDITRYVAQLLIFLGLLGTFYGLATTIPGVVETIRALQPRPDQSAMEMFDQMMAGLGGQLDGMATAFSSSLLGLAGSLVIGLLELFAAHGQNRFYRELEEWMTGFTRVTLAGADGDGGAALDHDAIGRFLDQMAAQTVALSEFYAQRDQQHEQDQLAADERAVVMATSVERLANHVLNDGEAAVERAAHLAHALGRIAEGQDRVVALLRANAQTGQAAAAPTGEDDARIRLRSIDASLQRLVADSASGRADAMTDLRADIARLTRAVQALGGGAPDGGARG